MMIVCGRPARPRLDQPVGPGLLFARQGDSVDAYLVPFGSFTLDDLLAGTVNLAGADVPRDAEVWFEPLDEKSH